MHSKMYRQEAGHTEEVFRRKPTRSFTPKWDDFIAHSHILPQRNFKSGGNQDEAPAFSLAVSW